MLILPFCTIIQTSATQSNLHIIYLFNFPFLAHCAGDKTCMKLLQVSIRGPKVGMEKLQL